MLIGCNKEEPIPAYIRIDSIGLTGNPSLQGSMSHKIVDAWIYIDDQLVGAFELPCRVPVLYEGSKKIKVYAGVKENGISSTRIPYPFYGYYETEKVLTPGEILLIQPVVQYTSSADFPWLEDFEGGPTTSLCDSAISTDTNMVVVNSPAFEGIASGGIFLSKTAYQEASCNRYTLPKDGGGIFLEMNYQCNSAFNVGIIGYASNNTIDFQQISLTLRPTDGQWNKVYVNLTNEVLTSIGSEKYSVFFSMLKDANQSTSIVYVDNIKLIH